MNGAQPSPDPTAASREEVMSGLFAGMVIQQTNMALMMLGKVPHPDTGKTVEDLEGARMFIDQLEMLEAKTKGNLGKDEEKLLKQSLTAVRLAFVNAVGSQAGPTAQPESTAAGSPPQPAERAKSSNPADQPAPPWSDEESRKKFSKKY